MIKGLRYQRFMQLPIKKVENDNHLFPKLHDFLQVLADIEVVLLSLNKCIDRKLVELTVQVTISYRNLVDIMPNRRT